MLVVRSMTGYTRNDKDKEQWMSLMKITLDGYEHLK